MTSDDPAAAAKDIGDRARKAAEDAKGKFDDATSSARSRTADAASKVSETASDVYQRVRDSASYFGDRLPSANDAVDAGRRVYEEGTRHVARQPIEALLLAGAIGYLVGWAANRS